MLLIFQTYTLQHTLYRTFQYYAFQKFVESLARPSNCCVTPPNCRIKTDSKNSRRIAIVRAIYYNILLVGTSPSLLDIENYTVKS
jgi:hypothetical protein